MPGAVVIALVDGEGGGMMAVGNGVVGWVATNVGQPPPVGMWTSMAHRPRASVTKLQV